jgi:hypothetical protein
MLPKHDAAILYQQSPSSGKRACVASPLSYSMSRLLYNYQLLYLVGGLSIIMRHHLWVVAYEFLSEFLDVLASN